MGDRILGIKSSVTDYSLYHSKCGAAWEDFFSQSPEMITCIKCGETVKIKYAPILRIIEKGDAEEHEEKEKIVSYVNGRRYYDY